MDGTGEAGARARGATQVRVGSGKQSTWGGKRNYPEALCGRGTSSQKEKVESTEIRARELWSRARQVMYVNRMNLTTKSPILCPI